MYHVPSLPVADPARSFEELAGNEAVALFTERAAAVDPDFELTSGNAPAVARICARVDGLPLAIELAAAQAHTLPVDQLERRLVRALDLLVGGARDLPPRQRTLRSTLDWSFELLEQDAQVLLPRLAVFTGGFTLESLEALRGVSHGGRRRASAARGGAERLSDVRLASGRHRVGEEAVGDGARDLSCAR